MKFLLLILHLYSVQVYAQMTYMTGTYGPAEKNSDLLKNNHGYGSAENKPSSGESFNIVENTSSEKNIEITITKNTKPVSCELESGSSQYYICAKDTSPFLVKHTSFGYSALIINAESLPEVINLNRVEANGKLLHEESSYKSTYNKYEGYGTSVIPLAPVQNQRDLPTQFTKTINDIHMFLPRDSNNAISFEKSSPEFKKLASEFISESDKLSQIRSEVFKEKNYQVELKDGKKINCERDGVKPLSPEQVEHEKETGEKIQCPSFKCDPLIVDGKKYQATLLYDSIKKEDMLDGPSVMLTNEDGIGPRVRFTKIVSNKSPVPIYHNPINQFDSAEITTEQNIGFVKANLSNPTFRLKLQTYEAVCSDNASSLKKLLEAKNKFADEMANMQLVQLISMMGNASTSGLVDVNYANKIGCFYDGIYFDKEAEKKLELLKKDIHPDKKVTQTIKLDRATELFNKAKNMKDIAWNYKVDGCYARAHLMARRFEAEGVRVDKVWISGDLSVPEENINWNFHVAPIVYVEDEKGKIIKMVIDPSLFNKPVTVDEWDKKIAKATKKGSELTAYPFPPNAFFYERAAIAFSSSDPYLPNEAINFSEEEKMKMATRTMADYIKIK